MTGYPHDMELWLVRHGDTITEKDGLYKPHNGLTELGRQQAKSVAKVLANSEFDVCYSSALPRAVQTAEIFADMTANRFTQIPELNEIEVGRIEEASAEFKSRVINHQVTLDFSEFGGENSHEFYTRIVDGFAKLIEDADSRRAFRVLGFLHGGTIGAILDHISGRDFNYRRRPRMPNCSYTVVSKKSDRGWTEWEGWYSDHLTSIT